MGRGVSNGNTGEKSERVRDVEHTRELNRPAYRRTNYRLVLVARRVKTMTVRLKNYFPGHSRHRPARTK